MKRFAGWALTPLVAIYLAASGYMYAAQESFIFKPDPVVKPISEIFPSATEVQIETTEDLSLQAWHKPAVTDAPTLVMFHGNAGNLSTRPRFIDIFDNEERGVLIFSWRGFGNNPGSPSEQGLYTDARSVLDWLNKQGVSDDQILIYGESLGSGVATQIATERELLGVILAAPYTSIADLAKQDYPWLPVDLLLKHRFDSIDKIDQVNEPLVVLHSEDDQVIPYRLGQQLFHAANQPKRLQSYTDRKHTGFTEEDIETAIRWIDDVLFGDKHGKALVLSKLQSAN